MELVHDTPFAGDLASAIDNDGAEIRIAVLKATYEILGPGAIRIAERQEPVYPGDVFAGDPGSSSTLIESDFAHHKPNTDIVVLGDAVAPGGRPQPRFQCAVGVGAVSKSIEVFGDRVWSYSRLGSITMSPPVPVERVPLRWERAFGGKDPADPSRWEPRNPVGVGYRVTRSPAALDGARLPNFEDPRRLLQAWDDKPAPQGFGFVGRGWEPRLRHAGTYDEAWKRDRMPILPVDFDERFWNGAPPDLVHPGHLRGGEIVAAVNLSPAGTERFVLPMLAVRFHAVTRRRRIAMEGVLDTVLLHFSERRFTLVWRARYPVSLNERADEARAEVHPAP